MQARIFSIVIATLIVVTGGTAFAETAAQFRIDGRPHVDVAFELDLLIEGFDESPAPDLPPLQLPNATVTPLGATPNVSRSIQIINGRRADAVTVTWVLRWRVEVHKEGSLRVPTTIVVQGTKTATAAAGDVAVDTIPTTDDMKISLALPNRPVFVGETVPVELVWLFRQQPDDQSFAVPLMTLDAFTVSTAPVTDKTRALPFSAGGKDISVPYAADTVDVGGQTFHRIRFTFFVAPRRSGKVEIPASSVVAGLAVGRRDFFGNAATRPFRAMDVPHTIDVKPLPETDRPPSFAGAVGDQFSIAVHASRSVVQLGEPVELDVTVKSSQRLDALSLGKLDGPGGLPKDKFTVPPDAPTGELSADGLAKTFKITAQVTGLATEIPALEFAYFDPAKSSYLTIHSDPIALSVKGGSIVGSEAVVSATPRKGASAHADTELALVNADLALSSSGTADDQPLGGAVLWILIGLLYAIPLGVFAARTWQLRTREQREDAAEVRAARRRVQVELDRAKTAPARDAAGPIASAIRELARTLGSALDDDGLLAKLETEAFAPSAAELPLSSEIRTSIAKLVDRMTTRPASSRAVANVAVVLLCVAMAPGLAHAEGTVETGRAAYREAMQTIDPAARKIAFARAAAALESAVHDNPGHPELLADWGNASLGAGDVGRATLAYRRALALDGANGRALHNLGWLRSRQTDVFRPADGGAADSLFFFHQWPRSRRLLVAGVAFAACVLVLVPWSGRRRRGMFGLAALPFAIWIAMLASIALEDRHPADGVVLDDVVLRAADSTGAPAAMGQSIPRGAEVTMLERRDAWTRIQIANGTSGWVQAGAVEPVTR